jgi:hypothetical protein
MPTYHCRQCKNVIDIDPQNDWPRKLASDRTCPMCKSVSLRRQCAGKPFELTGEWWYYCECCGSYWQVSAPEPDLTHVVADYSGGFAQGQFTIDADGYVGKFLPEWFNRPDSDCFPLTER